MLIAIGYILAAYLLGTIPQVYLLGLVKGKDLRKGADLHAALWDTSRPLGAIGLLGDLLKGYIPVGVAGLLGLERWVWGAAGVAVVVGQMWPAFLPSSGGKGNSTGLPMAGGLAPVPLLLALIPVFGSLIIRTAGRRSQHDALITGPPSRVFPVGMLTGFALMPVAGWWLGEPLLEVTLPLLALFLAIVVRRLTAGLRADLKGASSSHRLLLNRFLYDRSWL